MLWQIIDRIFDLDLKFENTPAAVKERKEFLASKGIGICDTVESCRREKIDASDLGMLHVELRDLIGVLRAHEKINTLLFTGGNSKNGPEFFFRRILKEQDMKIKVISKAGIPWHRARASFRSSARRTGPLGQRARPGFPLRSSVRRL